MKKYLTLGMSESKPGTGEFNVLAMNMKTGTIDCFNIDREQIRTPEGIIQWDLGKITEVAGIKLVEAPPTIVYTPEGQMCLSTEKVNLKECIEDCLSDYRDFELDNNRITSLIRVRSISNIETVSKNYNGQTVIKNYIYVSFGSEDIRILDKDFRWLNYWTYKRANDSEHLQDAISRYLNLFNNPNKKLYLVMYKRFIRSSPMFWVAGMHLL